MKNLVKFILLFVSLLAVSQASIFSRNINPKELIGKYQCHGDDIYYHVKYVGSFTLAPDSSNADLLVYQATYSNLNSATQKVVGLAYIDRDTLVLAFRPNNDEPQGVGNYRVSGGGKYLRGRFLYLVSPQKARLGKETCERIES